jgi:hypothetical protein
MKLVLSIILICTSFITYGQDSKKLGKSFVMTQNYLAQKCNAVGSNKETTEDALERTFTIIVEAMTSTGYVISVPEFDKPDLDEKFSKTNAKAETKSADGTVIAPAEPSKDIYFFIPFSEFDKVAEKAVSNHSFTVGIPTIPAKIRFGNGGNGDDGRYFRFEGNISLGLSGGYKYSFGEDNKNAVNVLLGFTVSSVQVDNSTTKGKVSSNTSAASFSPHLGFVFEADKFQFGLYTGIDFLNGEPNNYWVYRNQPWLGIGLGYSIFSVGNTSSNK